ncbi:hypothetical protein [Amycolatopsis sp. NPDC102389]|uniref:hypothetical protein n=1 Tax=Amycolatopsis sp. NPDC102389 TaxID=3363941 RepID=UPI00382AE36F
MGRIDEITDLELLAAAYHEGGHAVLHKLNGGTVHHVKVTASGAYTRTAEDCPDEDDPFPYLVMVMAGHAAEARFYQVNGFGSWKADSMAAAQAGGDRANFGRHSRGTGISRGQALNEAKRQVRRHWGRIDRVARVLAARGHLSGSQV